MAPSRRIQRKADSSACCSRIAGTYFISETVPSIDPGPCLSVVRHYILGSDRPQHPVTDGKVVGGQRGVLSEAHPFKDVALLEGEDLLGRGQIQPVLVPGQSPQILLSRLMIDDFPGVLPTAEQKTFLPARIDL